MLVSLPREVKMQINSTDSKCILQKQQNECGSGELRHAVVIII